MATRVLIIEDNNEDFQSILRALGDQASTISITRSLDGDDALDMLRDIRSAGKIGHLPEIILLDLNMPGTDGREILVELKSDAVLKNIPVVVLSSSNDPKDVAYCYDKSANAYCLKPVDRKRFEETIQVINAFWFRMVALPRLASFS